MATDQELLIRINGSAKEFINEMDKVNRKTKDLQKGLTTVAKTSAVAFTALAGAVGVTVARFSQFEKTFSNVQTLLDKSSFSTKSLKDGVEGLQKGVIALGASSGQSFENLNKGLFDIISATGDAENAMGVLESATQLAIAGGTDVSVAVDGITTAIKAFGLETGDAQSIAEKFFQAQKGGKTTVEELSSSLGVAASTAAAYNVSLDELLAASSAATLAGIKTNATFTGLKAVFANVSKPTAEAAAEAKRLGIQFDSASLRSQGLEGFLKTLTGATGFTKTSIEKLFGSVEAQGVAFALTGAQAEDFSKQIKLLADEQAAAATFADALAVKQATTEQALARLSTSVDAIAVTFGSAFAPAINVAADALTAVAKEISSMDKETVKTIANVVAITTAIAGLTALLAGAALGYLKLRTIIIATNTTLGITDKIQKAYNLTLAISRNALAIFRTGMIAATTTIRGFAAATGIGLVLVALGFLITDFKRSKAAILGSLSAAGAGISEFVKAGSGLLSDFGELLKGVFTFDTDKIKSSLDNIQTGLAEGFSNIGEASAKAFNESFDASIAESDAAEKKVQPVQVGSSGEPVDRAVAGEGDNSALEEKLAERKDLIDQAAAEEKAAADERQIEKDEENALRTEQELAAITDRALTEAEIKAQLDKEERKKEIEKQNQFLKDKIKFGEATAKINQFLNQDEVKGASQAAGQLVALTRSKNSTLKGIGKAASIAKITIDTASGAVSAYQALAGIPIVGPALGIGAAAALTAFGAEQIANVNSAQAGGFVPPTSGGSRDRSLTLTEPNELIVPAALAPDFIQSVGRPDTVGEDISEDVQAGEIIIGFDGDEAQSVITARQNEARSLGTFTGTGA